MTKVVTFGEIMMRLDPVGYYRFVQADSFDVSYSGAEANVAVSLANYGLDAYFVCKVPNQEIGQACGICHGVWSGGRWHHGGCQCGQGLLLPLQYSQD